jgi:hypothetical protein
VEGRLRGRQYMLPLARSPPHICHSSCGTAGDFDQTIMSLAGHLSRSMLARYSHIRSQAKQEAIAALE